MNIYTTDKIRNVVLLGHGGSGKTSLAEAFGYLSGITSRMGKVDDGNTLSDYSKEEQKRHFSISTSVIPIEWEGYKINIIDTPGHADFGGEVERVLSMVDGAILLVDAAEGPMPQTRFVLSKALEMNLKIIVVVNKIDRPDARLDEIADEVLELLMDLDASEEQLENTPFLYCSGRAGTASFEPHGEGKDLKPLFDTIMSYVNPPEGDPDQPLQMLISSIDYNEYVGRIGIGRIERGTI